MKKQMFALLGLLGLLLCSPVFGAALPGSPPPADLTVTLGEQQFYCSGATYSPCLAGPYSGYVFSFNAAGQGIVAGKDFLTSMRVTPLSFPSNTNFYGKFPSSAPANIRGFNHLSYGDYNGTVAQTPITARRVSAITTLTESADTTITGGGNDSDVLTDFFLTTVPGDSNPHQLEVSIFTRTPSYTQTYFSGSTSLGNTTISGITWNVAVDTGSSPNVILMKPNGNGDIPVLNIDVLAVLNYLAGLGRVNTAWYFNGLAHGVECYTNTCNLYFNNYSVTYN